MALKTGKLLKQLMVKEIGVLKTGKPGTSSKAKAEAPRAKASLVARADHILLLEILLLLILGMLPLFKGLAGLVPTSVHTAGSKATTGIRAPNWPLRTLNGKQMDGRLLVLVVFCACIKREN